MDPTSLRTSTKHCDLCSFTPEEFKKAHEMTVIFLGVDVTLYKHVQGKNMVAKYNAKLEELFGNQERYTFSQYREVNSYFLLPHAASNLNKLIASVEAQGKKVGIVLASACGHECTTEQLCTKMFLPFFPGYVIGRTPSTDTSFDPELKRRLEKGERSFKELAKERYGLKLSGYCEKIDYWIREHGIKNFVILRLSTEEKMPKRFGDRFIDTCHALDDRHVEAALNVLI